MLMRWWEKYQRWWSAASSADKVLLLGVCLATIGGSVYRLFRLPLTMQFLADQGRDALIAHGILHGDIALVGPSTSVGSMFLGPLYYYFMAPFLGLAGWSPLGPTVMMALLGIVTIPILYWVGSKLVGRWPAWFATLLYASAPYVAEYTRFSWNPNPAPIVMLVLLYSVWRAWRGSAWWWLSVAFWFAVIIQLHYVALLALAPAGLFWLADLYRSFKRGDRARLSSLGVVTTLCVMLVVMSFAPLFVFNWKFDNVIVKGFSDFFSKEKGLTAVSPGQKIWTVFREQHGRGMQVLFELWGKEWFSGYRGLNTLLFLAYGSILSLGTVYYRRTKYFDGYMLIFLTIITSILGLSFYKSTVFFHYFSYFYPVSYLATGLVIFLLAKVLHWPGKVMALALMAYVLFLSVTPTQLLYLKPLGWTSVDMEKTANEVLRIIPQDKSYGMVLLSEVRDYRGLNYRYFLQTSSHPPQALETSHEADFLVIIAETPREPKDVLGSPVYEIVVYPKGPYKIHEIPNGPRIYVIANKERAERGEIVLE